MCGLLAFTGIWNRNPGILGELIHNIRRRGPDMLGVAWREGADWKVRRWQTPSWPEVIQADEYLNEVSWGMAHARLSTSGDGSLADAQPIQIGEMLFGHNGTVYRHRELAAELGFECSTGNDSEILGQMIQRFGPVSAMKRLEAHQGETPHAWIAATPKYMWIASLGQPLYLRDTGVDRCVSSWPFYRARTIPAGTVLEWRVS